LKRIFKTIQTLLLINAPATFHLSAFYLILPFAFQMVIWRFEVSLNIRAEVGVAKAQTENLQAKLCRKTLS